MAKLEGRLWSGELGNVGIIFFYLIFYVYLKFSLHPIT